jgi:heat shock protein HslJ
MHNGIRYFLLSAILITLPLVAACAPITPPPVMNAPAAHDASATDSLTAPPWQWVAFTSPVEQVDVDTPERYLLTFGEDGIVEIVADCNTAIGSYGVDSLDGGSLAIDVAPRTTDACGEGSRGEQFLKLLSGAARYFFEDDRLYIDLMANSGTLIFAAVEGEAGAAAPG